MRRLLNSPFIQLITLRSLFWQCMRGEISRPLPQTQQKIHQAVPLTWTENLEEIKTL
jgi:hypothetical protein